MVVVSVCGAIDRSKVRRAWHTHTRKREYVSARMRDARTGIVDQDRATFEPCREEQTHLQHSLANVAVEIWISKSTSHACHTRSVPFREIGFVQIAIKMAAAALPINSIKQNTGDSIKPLPNTHPPYPSYCPPVRTTCVHRPRATMTLKPTFVKSTSIPIQKIQPMYSC